MATKQLTKIAKRADAGRTLAHYAATLPFSALPDAVVRLTKQCILDTLGTTLAATTLAPQASLLHDYVREVGGSADSTLIGYGAKAPAQMAAFLNGANSHLLDYDDVGCAHVSVATVPVAFAVAEKEGKVSGRELLTAIALGMDIHTRLFPYESIDEWIRKHRFSSTQTLGYISGAAVAGRLSGLSEDRLYAAMGLAYQQAAGAEQPHLMLSGWCCQSAVQAALLAKRGVPGVTDLLDGPNGLYQVYLRDLEPDPARLLGELGTRFHALESHGFKAWPACGSNRRPVNCILDLRKEHKLQPADVKSIVVAGGELIMRLAEPLEEKRRPAASEQAKTSLPFTCAVAMIYGDVKLCHYTEAGLRDPKVLAMADRISAHKADSRVPSVTIEMSDGTRHQKQVVYPLGDDRQNPMSQQQIEDKFRDCTAYSEKQISDTDARQIIALVANLEDISDVREITRLL